MYSRIVKQILTSSMCANTVGDVLNIDRVQVLVVGSLLHEHLDRVVILCVDLILTSQDQIVRKCSISIVT